MIEYGSSVRDSPHMMSDQIATNLVLRSGYAMAVTGLGKERADLGQQKAIKWMWSGAFGEDDELNPARWNEIHSPDYIEVLPQKQRKEEVRCIALVAQNGLFSGGWHGWWHIQGGMTAPGGAVAAVSRRPDFLDIFVVGIDGGVWTAAWSPVAGAWGGWWQIPGVRSVTGSPPITCVSRSIDKLDIFIGQKKVV
jgi:hypothetical protein